MELLDKYIKAKQEILEYFGCEGYSQDISDNREYYWYNQDDETIYYNESKPSDDEDFDWESGYASEIYGGRRQSQNVFRKDGFTMVMLTSDFGDGEYFAIFDNSKETKE